MKECFKCKKVKNLICFYKHSGMKDGYLNKCKECSKIDSKNNFEKNHEYYLKYDKLRNSLPHRKKARIEYQKTVIGKKNHNISSNKWRKNNPEKYAAHIILNNRLAAGKIKRKNCQLCGNPKTHAHHDDYSKPLKVKWLCNICHKFKHNVEKLKE